MSGNGRLKLSQDHLVTLRALEVLKLIGDRMERHDAVDSADIDSLMRFFHDVTECCLDNTEKSLLVPFMNRELSATERTHLASELDHHCEAHSLLKDMEKAFQEGRSEEFIAISRRYTTVLGDLIFDEIEFLPALFRPLYGNPQVQEMLAEFDKAEGLITDQVRVVGRKLQQLEAKYIDPHCI